MGLVKSSCFFKKRLSIDLFENENHRLGLQLSKRTYHLRIVGSQPLCECCKIFFAISFTAVLDFTDGRCYKKGMNRVTHWLRLQVAPRVFCSYCCVYVSPTKPIVVLGIDKCTTTMNSLDLGPAYSTHVVIIIIALQNYWYFYRESKHRYLERNF